MLISMELNDDHSEKVRYDYPDYPIYIRKGLLSIIPTIPRRITGMMLSNLFLSSPAP